jgi:hypothetical protein
MGSLMQGQSMQVNAKRAWERPLLVHISPAMSNILTMGYLLFACSGDFVHTGYTWSVESSHIAKVPEHCRSEPFSHCFGHRASLFVEIQTIR